MRVLFLTDGIFPFQIGGMQKHSLVLAKLLIERKVFVHILHCGGEGYTTEAFNALFETHQQDYFKETYIKFPKTDPFPGHYIRENKTYSKNAYLELENQMQDYDLVYAQGFSGWRFIKERRKKKFDAPVLVNFHGLEMFQTPPGLRVMAEYTLFKNSVKWNLRNADYVYSFGGKIDEILLGLGIQQDRILLQSNGIEAGWLVDEVRKPETVRKFVFVGRAERRKGVEELNAALKILIDESIDFEFSFIGPVPEKIRLNHPKINYQGEIRDAEKIKTLLREHDCLVCPSHSEGMPTVILEAMASGLAIIATNVGAVKRQIDGNGILLEKIDVAGLTKSIHDMVHMPESNLQAQKEKSIALIKTRFLWSRVVDQKISDFNSCLDALATAGF